MPAPARNRSVAASAILFSIPLFVCAVSGVSPLEAQDAAAVRAEIQEWRFDREPELIAELEEWLALPNVATDIADMRRNAEWLRDRLAALGAEAELLEIEGAPPAVFGRLDTPGATRTVMVYAHFDGQPVVRELWTSDPWDPVYRVGGDPTAPAFDRAALEFPVDPDTRIWARSASDDKSPITAFLAALRALDDLEIEPSVNLRFFFEGEEEAGSPNLHRFLDRYRDRLSEAEAWILADGPMHISGRQQVTFGVRGVIGMDLEIYGPARQLHSGHYGNWAPNPAFMLAELITTMRDSEGYIRIDGFDEAVVPPTEAELAAIEAMPRQDEQLRRDLQLGRSEGAGERIERTILRPALNVQGLHSGGVGENQRNAIPTSARAAIGFRLVPDLRPERVRDLVEAHIRAQGYHIVHEAPDAETLLEHPRVARISWGRGYGAARTSPSLPVSEAVLAVTSTLLDYPPIVVPTLGGSLPTYDVLASLDAPMIGVPMVNADNNQHSPNENLRLGNYFWGIELYGALIAALGEHWEAQEAR